jgi:hypothetical protein
MRVICDKADAADVDNDVFVSDDDADDNDSVLLPPSSESSLKYVALLKHDCPHVAEALAPVARMLRRRQLAPPPPPHAPRCFTELEARLGRVVVDGAGRRRFVPGVTPEYMARLLALLEASPAWHDTQPWTHAVDRLYTLPSGVKVRTTTSVARRNGGPPQLHVSHVTKTAVAHVDLRWRTTTAAAASSVLHVDRSAGVFDVRVSLKDETVVPEAELPVRTDATTLVRIKQRQSFRYKPRGEEQPLWSIDLTLVWSAPTYLDALRALQSNATPTYEVEVECLRSQGGASRVKGASADTVALSLLLKVADLFAAQPTAGADVTATLAAGHVSLAPL